TVLSPIFGFIFYVDAGNSHIRGDYFFIFITVYIINLLILIISTLKTAKTYNYPLRRNLIALSLFTILGTSIQLVYPLAYSSWHCVTLSLFLYFLLMSEFDSCFDSLTGLYNREAFDKAIKQLTETKAFSVIILDIDDFKSVNDTYGHDYGDTAIKTVAAIIQKSFNKHYTCYRFGGDEFSVIGNETDKEKIEYQLRTMTNNIAEMRKKGNPLPTISYGYSIFQGGEKLDFQKILKEADDLMYHFKRIHKANAVQENTTIP
ncbi:MAG: GGDEF domain-containing protein, partial [Caldicoprobacterales bacterium]